MTAELILHRKPDNAELILLREQLTQLRVTVAEREAAMTTLRSTLNAFEARYFRQVGVLYAELDDMEARITEREVALYDSDAARERARQARERARESHEAAYSDEMPQAEFQPAPALKALFREVARRIHPDRAQDTEEREHFTLLMARANAAYRRGDAEVLRRLLDDHRDIARDGTESAAAAEEQRLTRHVLQAKRDIALLDAERDALLEGDVAHLHADAEVAALEFRDLLAELAAKVRGQMEDARRRFEFVDRQITAHGR